MIGRTVSHYRVVDKLGEGGMGVVYKARDLHLPRFVALKCLSPHLAASSSEMARLEREAEAICTLNHPHVAVIHGIENADGRKFLVLEYLPGGTLKQQVEARGPDGPPMPLAQALDYAIQIGEGLAHAHSKGIVHRDVKTANALLTEDGAVKITDFGLSGSQGSPEGTGIHGTPAYMSTEQARGETADERSDIFSFGVVLFELVTGHLPFEAPDPEATLRMILDTPAPTLKRYREGVPESLERIVARSLAKDRRERYSRMDDVLADLRPELDKLRAKSRQQTMPIKPVKKRKWRRLLAAAGALAVLVVALCLAIWLWPKPRHLAVLPFTVVDSDAANQRFADVLGETVSNKLTQLSRYHRSLRIVPVSDLRAEAISSPTKARRIFHAELAITGMVRRQGDRLLVTVNLIDATVPQQINGFEKGISVADVGYLQDGIVEEIVKMLALDLKPEARAAWTKGDTADPNAYDYYTTGKGYIARGSGGADYAIPLFQKAIDRDPGYALAHAGMAEALLQKYTSTKDLQWLEQARRHSNRAIEISPQVAPVRVTLGELTRLTGRYQEAILEYQRALDLDPTSFDAYNGLAAAYLALGKFDEAVAIHRRAIGLRPDYWKGHYNLAVSYLERGRDAEAEPLFRRATELAPDHAVAHSSLGAILIRLGRYPEAQKELEVSLGLKPNPFGYNNLSIVLSFQGRFADAVHAMEKAVELGGEDGYRVGNLAGTYRWAGDLAKAGAAYQKAAELVERELAASPNNAFLHAILANYSAYLDRPDKARAEIERARQLEGANVSVLLQSLIVYERLGNRDRSWEPLAAIVKQNRSMNQLYAHPDLAALRLDPRFKAVVNNLHQ